MIRLELRGCLLALAVATAACGSGQLGDDDQRAKQVTDGMRASTAAEIESELQAAIELMNAAPTPTGRGWDATLDANAITSMRDSWVKARLAWEHIEGVISPLFPDIDKATDSRYEDFLMTIGSAGDQDLFDGQGVTGLHAVERILYSDQIPDRVVQYESSLAGYKAAQFPATEQEAMEFKTELCQDLVDKLTLLKARWAGFPLDFPDAFNGLISLMDEQHEKVTLASMGADESRYSQHTLADMRANLVGTRNLYGLFSPWIKDKGGEATDGVIESGFTALDTAYNVPMGNAIPATPPTWNAQSPSASDLATPFGQLYTAVTKAVDPNREDSVVSAMNEAAALLGFPEFAAGP